MNWRRLLTWHKRVYIEEYRERKRIKLGRSRLADIFWYSSVYDYRLIRLLYNFPIGFCLGYAVYQLAWQRLNFADFHPVYSALFQWTVILGSAFAFAISPIFRCASICVFIGGLGKSGQGVLSLYIIEQLNEGPVANVLHNIELTSNIIICHLELEAEMINQRVSLTTGPLEELFERNFGSSTMFGKKVVKMLKSLIEPFRSELQFANEEDDVLTSEIDGASAFVERQSLVIDGDNGTEMPKNDTIQPEWTKLKTELGRNAARRAEQRCQQTFAATIRRCHETFGETQAKCYDNLPIIGYLVCWQFNSLEICQPAKIQELAEQKCKFGKEMEESGALSPDLDNQMENLHFVAVEEPSVERMRILGEIKSEIKSDVKFFKLVSKTMGELLATLLILLIYCTFRDTIQMIRSYLSDIDFKNHFVTSYFRQIDGGRRIDKKLYLRPLRDEEIEQYNLQSPFSPPSAKEIRKAWQPLVRFFITIAIVLTVVLLDYYFYRVLHNVVTFGRVQAKQQGVHTVNISVEGRGPVAEMVRSIVEFNFTNHLHKEVSNQICMVEPKQPDWPFMIVHIFLPLFAMLILQVMFSYVISRIVLFYVVGMIFRKRSKARIIQLYNRVLLSRARTLELEAVCQALSHS